MSAESSGVFTLKEINRIKIIQDVIERRITTRRAAEHLGISDRQCRRLLARYREGGPLGMASRRCGMRGNRQLPPGLADQALELIKTRYADFGPTLAREKLEEPTDCSWQRNCPAHHGAAGLWVPRKQRAARIPQPRYRRPCTGELIQIDGCDHDWFEGRGPACTALVYVDDATSKLMELLFVKSESTFLTSKPRGAISISMVNRWHCTAIKPVFFVLTINTPQAETGILSLGEPCMN
ncbi:transposase [Klebsiella pneumoniae]|uniref:Transposase n=1 Tax=Klebsiella pneumoniae TaxID=573 RepID=A0A378H9X6_KLEPN|nr:transposase [Klebsiella pneumoniae]